ncbi:MAG: hypothetical protein A3J28_13980 [Acidobacteria bacterium RIFCSPLOWO2_12_FULL_60_22]|nr:MAG: hypothetical protein A3J28_13980 [Acidobacteria bacterium RIFCSPLOWO2_12_FULL_60_22]
MARIKVLFRTPVVVFLLGLLATGLGYSSDTRLRGTVKSSDGKPMEGVAISARTDGKSVTTTVFTDEEGGTFSRRWRETVTGFGLKP